MNKVRLSTFTDAILAIIMTILILNLKEPAEANWQALWALRWHFFSYTVSFFWLGALWVSIHDQWSQVRIVDNKVIWCSIVMLFFASFFPYVTSFVSEHFDSLFAHMVYSTAVVLVTVSNTVLSWTVCKANGLPFEFGKIALADLLIIALGMVLAILFYAPLAMFSILIAGILAAFLPLIIDRKKAGSLILPPKNTGKSQQVSALQNSTRKGS